MSLKYENYSLIWNAFFLHIQKIHSSLKLQMIFITRSLDGNTNMVKIFWDFLMFDQIFLSAQVKQRLIISINYDIFELSHEFPRDLN